MAGPMDEAVDVPDPASAAPTRAPLPGSQDPGTIAALAPAYDADYALWLDAQMAALEAGHWSALDRANLIEVLAGLGRSEQNEIRNRLRVLLMHLLKWHFQPGARSFSWRGTIRAQRADIADVVATSPSLNRHPAKVLPEAYSLARDLAAGKTGLPLRAFPETCPYAIDEILNPDFWPGPLEPRID